MGYLSTFAPTARFARTGDTVSGRIIDGRMVQTSEYKKGGGGRPKYWDDEAGEVSFRPYGPDGKALRPLSQLELTVETGIPDETGETERRVFFGKKRLRDALKTAVKTSRDRRGLVLGGTISVMLTGTEPGEGAQDAQTWDVAYIPPAEGEKWSDFDTDTVHLVGGDTWRRGSVHHEEAPPAPAVGIAEVGPAVVAGAVDHDLKERQAEALDRIRRAQESSPLAQRLGIAPAKPADEIPF
jgi:hypothetical protein